MSEENYMTRGRSQVLFNYLPGKTFDYSGPYGIHRVTGIDAVPSSEVDKEFVGKRVLSRVRQWSAAENSLGQAGFPQKASQFNLVEPTKVRSELFPLLFYCSDCGIVDTYDDPEELAKYNSRLSCRHCDGDLRQYRYVFIHECGEIKKPDPGRCSACNTWDRWKLDTQDSQRFENFRWRCTSCGTTKGLNDYCRCSLNDSRMTLAVHSGSSVHIPHHFSLINIEQRTSSSVDSPIYAKKILARYLDLTDTPLDEIDLDQAGGGEEVQEKRTTLRQLRKMEESSPSDGVRETIQRLEKEIAELEESTDPLADLVKEYVSITEPQDGTHSAIADDHASIVYELRQYLSTIEEFERKSVREIITEAGSNDPQSKKARETRANQLEKKLHASGISSVTFTEEFPITNVVFGYSRGSRDEDEAMLMGFSETQVNTSGEGFPIFVDTVSTESTQIELDPRAVLGWLLENSLSDEGPGAELRDQMLDSDTPADRRYPVPVSWDSETVDNWLQGSGVTRVETEPLDEWGESEIRAWIVDNVTEIPEYSTIEVGESEKSPMTYFVYHLIHTFSHSVLKEITKLSGVSRTSLSEHLLPYSLSFIIYTDQREDFSLGGIYTMLESDLDDLISEIHSKGNNCVYDPVCSRRGSACFSCMHVSEVSCSHLNRNVGRDFLFGSKPAATRDIIGYLEVAEEYHQQSTG
ncbi:hypothetical protein [Haloarchaeobius sp. DYHT-AS-18]|uniref:hypothetical protein n=1 Tax=Haloarchaeobius sp. DYHT-AS-18 TaxID=3446117 RepID=UPI003EBDA144